VGIFDDHMPYDLETATRLQAKIVAEMNAAQE
jgi:hypothetical protein